VMCVEQNMFKKVLIILLNDFELLHIVLVVTRHAKIIQECRQYFSGPVTPLT
jgi:hypothetical protein